MNLKKKRKGDLWRGEGRRREAPLAKAMGVWQRGMVGCVVQGVTRLAQG